MPFVFYSGGPLFFVFYSGGPLSVLTASTAVSSPRLQLAAGLQLLLPHHSAVFDDSHDVMPAWSLQDFMRLPGLSRTSCDTAWHLQDFDGLPGRSGTSVHATCMVACSHFSCTCNQEVGGWVTSSQWVHSVTWWAGGLKNFPVIPSLPR